MRFRIATCASASAPYQIELASGVVAVRRPALPRSLNSGEISWAWCDGNEYTLQYPMYRRGNTPAWQISLRDTPVCCGRLVTPALRDALVRLKFPYMEWEFERRTLLGEGSGCRGGGLIQQRDGKRLAVWRPRGRGWDGVSREPLETPAGAIVVGMILAWIHDD